MRIKCVTILATLGLLLAAAPASAQVFCIPTDEGQQDPDLNDAAACAAATTTPFGALPTNLPANWVGRTSNGLGFHFGFGSSDEEGEAGRKNFGLGIEIPIGRASLGFAGGLTDYTCDVPDVNIDCKSAYMLGARYGLPLLSNTVGNSPGTSFILGLNGTVGFSNGDVLSFNDFGENIEFSARSISVGAAVPFGIVVRSGNITVTPFVEPAFFWGQTKFDASSTSFGSDEQTESGAGFAFGGGVSFGFTNGLALEIGFKKVMIDEANALIGLGISYQR